MSPFAAARCGVVAGLLVFGAVPSAAAYTVNSHVWLCLRVLEQVNATQGKFTVYVPPDGPRSVAPDECRYGLDGTGDEGPICRDGLATDLEIPQEVFEAVTQNPEAFKAGCVGPDGHLMPFLTDVTHANEFGPVALYRELLLLAETPREIAYVYGWYAHMAADVAVHGFANHYAQGAWCEIDFLSPSTHGRMLNHIVAEILVQKHGVETKDTKLDVPIDFLIRVFADLDSPALAHVYAAVEQPEGSVSFPTCCMQSDLSASKTCAGPGKLGVLGASIPVELAKAFRRLKEYIAAAATLKAAAQAQAAAIQAAAPWTYWLSLGYWTGLTQGYFFSRAEIGLTSAKAGLDALAKKFFEKNAHALQKMVDGDSGSAVAGYLAFYVDAFFEIFAITHEALWDASPEWFQWALHYPHEWSKWLGEKVKGVVKALGKKAGVAAGWMADMTKAGAKWTYRALPTWGQDLLKWALDTVTEAYTGKGWNEIDKDIDKDFEAFVGPKATSCLPEYHFVHNARLLILAALADPELLTGVRSLDACCEFKHTAFWEKYDAGSYVTFKENMSPGPPAVAYCGDERKVPRCEGEKFVVEPRPHVCEDPEGPPEPDGCEPLECSPEPGAMRIAYMKVVANDVPGTGLHTILPGGGDEQLVVGGTASLEHACDRQGKWLYYVNGSDLGNLYRVGVDGAAMTRLTEETSQTDFASPAVRPDGGAVAMIQGNALVVYDVAQDAWAAVGAGVEGLESLSYGPDGGTLYGEIDNQVVAVAAGGGAPVPVTPKTLPITISGFTIDVDVTATGPNAAPNSGRIAFVTSWGVTKTIPPPEETSLAELYWVDPKAGDAFQTITDKSGQGFAKLDPAWSPDESLLAFAGAELGNLSMALYVATAAGGAIQPVLKDASVNIFDPCWIPAGGL